MYKLKQLMERMPPLVLRNWLAWSVWLSIFCFPIFAAGAEGGASYPFAWLVLVGLLFGWKSWPDLYHWERQVFVGFAIFFMAVFASFLFGEDVQDGIRRLGKYASLLWSLPAYLAIRRFVREPGRPLLGGLILAPLAALAFGLDWQFERLLPALKLQQELAGFYGTIIFSNITVLLAFLLLVAVIIFAHHWRWLFAGGLLVFLGLYVVVASTSRSGMLFIPVGFLLVTVMLFRNLNRRHAGILLVMFAITSSSVALLPNNMVMWRLTHAYAQLVKSDSWQDVSIRVRLELWQDSISIWREAPILGVGPGAFAKASERYISERRSRRKVYGHAHSIYFDALATLGILGFSAMLWFAFCRPLYLGYEAWRESRDSWQQFYAVGLVLTLSGFMVFGLTEAWFLRNPMFRTYLLCVLIMMAGLAGLQWRATTAENE